MTEVSQQRMVQVSSATVESINLALTLLCTWINELGGFGGGAPIANLTAERLVRSDENQAIASVEDLTDWVTGFADRITVSDDGDGTITVTTPQNIGVTSTPSFTNVKLADLSPARLTSTTLTGAFASVRDLMEWAYGYSHRIILDNAAGDGTIIIKTPQDIDIDSAMTLRSLQITDDVGTVIHSFGV